MLVMVMMSNLCWSLECVVVSQNKFLDSALAYFNVFFSFFSESVRFLQLLDLVDFNGGKWVFKIPILQ